ncbi:hypothetical protein FGG08_000063 [Glutinoglossum americanum]|uniref:Uncharacterized protein n=1 Tax=Glutinoglossum americanum TaxID=1670608 RepID=A0A9P8IB02_9PEZI|nr:hypothetical protein FGG08_000063 [Glutinoglossum americanum]
MATCAPVSSPRQPFASLDSPRLRNLANIKNRQNDRFLRSVTALPTTLSTPVKRRFSPVSTFEADSENIDPSLLDTPSKRVKNVDGSYNSPSTKCNITPAKKSLFVLTDTPASNDLKKTVKLLPSQSPARLANTPVSRRNKLGSGLSQKRDAFGLHKPGLSNTVLSTPAGRSPKNKILGNIGKRRTSSPFTRIDPPSSLQNAAPLSIDAALSGTIPNYKPKARSTPLQEIHIPTLGERATPAAWQFEIHEDTLEETLTNIMEFSTGVLDISDDESRRREKDDRGKENIPPMLDSETPAEPANAPATPSTSFGPASKPQRSREARQRQSSPYYRAPLGDLRPADFHGEGLDATSFVIVTSSPAEKSISPREFHVPSFATPGRPRVNPFASIKDERKEFMEKREEQGNWPSSAPTFSGFGKKDEEIVIWESGSGDEADAEEEKNSGSASDEEVFQMDAVTDVTHGPTNPLKRKCEADAEDSPVF